MIKTLPDTWLSTTLGAFSDLVNGRAFKSSDWSTTGLPIIRIQNLRNPKAAFNRFAGETDERHQVADGDLLFAWSGTPGTSFRAYVWSGGPAILNQHIFKIVFDPDVANVGFVRTAINAHLPALIKQAKGGAGLKHLTRADVEAIPVPLPPRAEQDRIVAAMERSVGRLAGIDAELAGLGDTIPLLERQVLAGLIIDQPEPSAQDGGVASLVFDSDATPARVRDLGEVQIGRQRSPDVHNGPSMRPYLRVANVLDDRIDASDLMMMHFEDAEFERYRLMPGDILLNEGQSLELVGRAAMYRGEPADIAFTNTLVRFRAGPLVDPDYALLVFRAYQKIGRFREIARITTNLAHLGAGRFAKLDFPLRPVDEQKRIASAAQGLIVKLRACASQLALLRGEAQNLIASIEAEALAGRLSEQVEGERPPVIVRLQTPRRRPARAETAARPHAKKAVSKDDMSTISLIEALVRSSTPLDGQALFAAAGYPEDASIIQVEQFFLELRSAVSTGRIRQSTSGDQLFSVAETGS